MMKLIAEDGPWVVLVFYLLYRDGQKDAATRQVLNKNTAVLVEMTALVRGTVLGAKGGL
ncbi:MULTISPECIES: hypothetical protein [Palleronia]|nr:MULTISPECIES: hypothetical protein [Palleronia]